jgi:predicted transcriptional regulator
MARQQKKIVTIGVSSIEQAKQRLSKAVRTGKFAGYGIYFLDLELMWRTLTPKRWDVLGAMVGQGPLSIREVARRVNRDVKAVHGDVTRLVASGLVKKTPTGEVEFPYDEIRVDFSIKPGEQPATQTKLMSRPVAKAA